MNAGNTNSARSAQREGAVVRNAREKNPFGGKDHALGRLAAANPVPEEYTLSPEESERSEQVLKDILSGARVPAGDQSPAELQEPKIIDFVQTKLRRSRQTQWLVAAVTALLIGASVVSVPKFNRLTPAAVASALTAAGDAVGNQPSAQDFDMTRRDYLKRIDANEQGSITTEYSAQGTLVNQYQSVFGSPNFQLVTTSKLTPEEIVNLGEDKLAWEKALEERFPTVARGALELLINPAVSNDQRRLLFGILSEQPGIHATNPPTSGVAPKVKAESFVMRDKIGAEDVTFTVLPETGQLIHASGLVAPGVVTTVQAAAVIGCVSALGTEGPDEMSLACADGNQLISGMQWSNWGSAQATTHALETINNCEPNCANGTFVTRGVDVVADNLQECGYGAKLYTRLRVIQSSGAEEVFDMGCAMPAHE